jgi:hypothetical protein
MKKLLRRPLPPHFLFINYLFDEKNMKVNEKKKNLFLAYFFSTVPSNQIDPLFESNLMSFSFSQLITKA